MAIRMGAAIQQWLTDNQVDILGAVVILGLYFVVMDGFWKSDVQKRLKKLEDKK